MLSMKTLKVAIVTMGSALLLGPGLAGAEEMRLDGTGAAAPEPVMYATETLPAADTKGRYGVAFPDTMLDLLVKPRRRIGGTEEVFIRLELSGRRYDRKRSSVNHCYPSRWHRPYTRRSRGN